MARIWSTRGMSRTCKILHWFANARDSQCFASACQGFHHFGMCVGVLVGVEMRWLDSCSADFFDLGAHLAFDGFRSYESGGESCDKQAKRFREISVFIHQGRNFLFSCNGRTADED